MTQQLTRPALSDERVQLDAAGQVQLELKTPWRDGTAHLVMSPLEFMQRLAALVPRLRLIRFHGVLAPNAKLRPLVVPQQAPAQAQAATEAEVAARCEAEPGHAQPHRIGWARLLKRVVDVDMQHCPNCGGELKIIAAILERPVIDKILTHLGLDPQPPPRAPATSTPEALPGGSPGGVAPPVDSMPQDYGSALISRPIELQAKCRVPAKSGRGNGPGASSMLSGPVSAAHAGPIRADKRLFETPMREPTGESRPPGPRILAVDIGSFDFPQASTAPRGQQITRSICRPVRASADAASAVWTTRSGRQLLLQFSGPQLPLATCVERLLPGFQTLHPSVAFGRHMPEANTKSPPQTGRRR